MARFPTNYSYLIGKPGANYSNTKQLRTHTQVSSSSPQNYFSSPTPSEPTSKSGISPPTNLTLNLPSKSSLSNYPPSHSSTSSSNSVAMESLIHFSMPCHTARHGLSSPLQRTPSSWSRSECSQIPTEMHHTTSSCTAARYSIRYKHEHHLHFLNNKNIYQRG
ncbi:hypothetical protein JOM56_005387 [Amanita muscaria]